MKKIAITLLLILSASSIALGQGYPAIGMFSDTDYVFCYEDVEQYLTTTIYVAAYLPPEIDGITAAEFRIDNLPENDAYGIVTLNWATDLVIGDPWWGIALAFTDPVPGPYAPLGSIDFFMIDPVWIGDDHLMVVAASYDSGLLVVVDDEFNTIDALGWMFTFNCTDISTCWCEDDISSPVEDSSWGAVKALY